MRKRLACLFIITILLFVFIGCGKSEEVIAVENAIDAIGSVTITSADKIEEAERMYSLLSKEDQNKVENYNLLLTARSEYDKIPKPVELATGNIQSYLLISLEYSKPETGDIYSRSDISLKMYPVKGGTFENVELTVEVPICIGWNVSSSDKAYDEANDDTLICTIKLPASGTYEETHQIIGFTIIDPSIGSRFYIKSVKGTFIPNN